MGQCGKNLHLNQILNLPIIDPVKIKSKQFKVVVDCINGAGEMILPELLQELGCDAIFINREANGHFIRNPEPIPENLGELCQAVIANNADLGIAVDPDVDRLALGSEKGIPLGEEYTLALVADFVLSKTPGPVAVNVSTTAAIGEIAHKYGQPIHRTPVGEINVVLEAIACKAVICGEGNGGVIYPALHAGRDAPVGIAMVLQNMAESQDQISEIHAKLPQYSMVKDKVTLSFGTDARALVDKLETSVSGVQIDKTDGLKLITEEGWVHIRASNTEPIIRVIAESKKSDQAQQLVEKYKSKLLTMGEK